MATPSHADILEAAGTALLIPGAWTQGADARNASGHFREPDDSDATSFCAIGAIDAATPSYIDNIWVLVALKNKINQQIPEWNDSKGQTAENVAKTMFELAAELRAKR